MLHTIDDFILHRLERFSHWTQRTIGWSCFTLSRIMAGGVCAAVLYELVASIWAHTVTGADYVWNSLIILVTAAAAVFGSVEERQYTECNSPLNRNQAEVTQRTSRVVLLCATSLWFLVVCAKLLVGLSPKAIYTPFILLHVYWNACTPLPPCMSRFRAWLRNSAPKMQREPVTQN